MEISTIIFYILATVVVVGGMLSVTTRKIFRAAIYLLFSLIGIAGIYFYLNYEFIAAVQIVVYVGGIIVLILFSIFLTHGSGGDMPKPNMVRIVFGALSAIIGFVLVHFIQHHYSFTGTSKPAVEVSASNIGEALLSTTENGYILPFEVVSVLLLSAMIGCIVIAIKIKVPPLVIDPGGPVKYHDDEHHEEINHEAAP